MSNNSPLHDFRADIAERRQYERLALRFPAWWLQGGRTDSVIAGIGIEISGGGIQFLLELRHQISEPECSIAFQIHGRKMRANVRIMEALEVLFNGDLWQRYRAKFEGLLSSDFDFIISLSSGLVKRPPGAAAPPALHGSTISSSLAKGKMSVGNLNSYDMLPTKLKEQIVSMLVKMKRLAPVKDLKLALMAAHYAGIHPAAEGDVVYHRFSIRTKTKTDQETRVFDTHFLISDDGATLLVRE